MRKVSIWFTSAFLLCAPVAVSAHTGGALDADGCHADHRTGSYHCHRGAAAGYSFPNRAAMTEAVRTGTFPEKTVEKDSFFSKLKIWPFGDKPKEDAAASDEGGPASANGTAASGKPGEVEKRLKVLQGLHEMGLITREEYEGKRKAVLDEL